MTHVQIKVPLLPPSTNHYLDKFVRKGRIRMVKSDETKAFHDAVAIFARGEHVCATSYRVEVWFAMNERQLKTRDCDNGLKVTLDALQKAGVIHNDADIFDLLVHKQLTDDEPTTIISVMPSCKEYERCPKERHGNHSQNKAPRNT